ncbi:uncharacterized protein LOC117652178 [Thrips palmi]|uniref:Uncharacterized protein LOC117652178 n=1 Tax=Thrips palmi TaxID=161013 RepID=A0A6P9A995_THRPL|nr:uncharacterized protein LOC117652178 [Thrips palmi]
MRERRPFAPADFARRDAAVALFSQSSKFSKFSPHAAPAVALHPAPLQIATMRSSSFLLAVLVLAAVLGPVQVMGGPAAYGICQSGCNALAVACYLAAGSVMGVGSVPACNVALGVCMTACIAAGAAPTL